MSRLRKLFIIGTSLLLIGLVLLLQFNKSEVIKKGSLNLSISPTVEPKDDLHIKGESIQEDDEKFLVVRVIDGDTIELENGNKVRYIGIDTPEIKHPTIPVQCYGKEAYGKNKDLVEGKVVRLEKDISEKDKYERLLRYVYVDDVFVNDYLVREGYAHASSYPPDVKFQNQFREAEKEAREGSKGLWKECKEVTEELKVSPTPQDFKKGEWECMSNVYNCSDFKTQAEAQYVFEFCGGTANDIHKLDRDKDGKVCETLP